ncbi:MAG TPA: hypothetical protein DGX96_01285 [Lachnospiraceae bacterium]|nr:hypothetical protein [Lachnospiraceae bacterium]
MSAVLGPIHQWMFDKIRLQKQLTKEIAELAVRNGWEEKDSALIVECTKEDHRTLEEAVDISNIHGSLSSLIDEAESAYGELVTALVAGHPERREAIEDAAYDFGTRHAANDAANPTEVYQIFNGNLLSGMPCDRVDQVTKQDEDHFSWELSADLHGAFWQDPALYYALRRKIMEGMLSVTDYELVSSSWDHYCIERKAS